MSASLRLLELEARAVPATLVSPTTMAYRDVDGDTVTVVLSKPLLSAANADAVFGFDTGAVDGDNSLPQQRQVIDLTTLGAAGNGVTVTHAARGAADGDGFAHVGHIDATGLDLGAVTIDGDLGRIRAGNATTTTSGLKALAVRSLGRYGLATGAPDLLSQVTGRLDAVRVAGDVKDAFLVALARNNATNSS